MFRTSNLFFAAFAVTALYGCGSGSGSYTPKPVPKVELATIGPDDGKLLFPLKVGNTWTYSVETQQGIAGQLEKKSDTLVLEIAALKPVGNGTQVSVKTTLNDDPAGSQTWMVDDRGIFQINVSDKSPNFVPPQPTMLFPLKPGANFEWKGTGQTVVGVPGEQAYKGTLLAPQLVDTGMGQITGIGVEAMGTFKAPNTKDGRVKVVSYWAKGIGLIRFRQDTSFTAQQGVQVLGTNVLTLKQYSLKKD